MIKLYLCGFFVEGVIFFLFFLFSFSFSYFPFSSCVFVWHMCECLCACMRTCIHACVHMCVRVCVCVRPGACMLEHVQQTERLVYLQGNIINIGLWDGWDQHLIGDKVSDSHNVMVQVEIVHHSRSCWVTVLFHHKPHLLLRHI